MATRSKISEKLARITSSGSMESKGASTPTNFLFRFFTKICLEIGLDGPLSIDRALENFIRDPRNGMRQDRPGIASDKNNLTKQMFPADKSHSWKVFVKSLRVAGFTEIEFTIRGKRAGGEVTVHSMDMKLPDYGPEGEHAEEPDELTKRINSLHQKDA